MSTPIFDIVNLWPARLSELSAGGPAALTAQVHARLDGLELPLKGRDVIVQYASRDGFVLMNMYRRLTPSSLKWTYMDPEDGAAAAQEQYMTDSIPVLMFRDHMAHMIALTTWKSSPVTGRQLEEAPNGSLATGMSSGAAYPDLLWKSHGSWIDLEAGGFVSDLESDELTQIYDRVGLLWAAPAESSL